MESSHPNITWKELHKIIDKNISELSYSNEKFDKTKRIYKKALDEKNFKVTLNLNSQQSKGKNRNRKIKYFNSPYNERVRTNFCKQLLKFINSISQSIPNSARSLTTIPSN